MPSFVWKGRTRTGQAQEGELLADTRDAAVAVLRRQQIQVVRHQGEGQGDQAPAQAAAGRRLASGWRSSPASSRSCSTPACRWCSAWRSSATRRRTAPSARSSSQARTDVESGASLADAMRKHPKAFDDLYVNMVAAGEAGGILDTILQRLSTYIEKIVKLKSQVKSALIYPAAVILIAALRGLHHPAGRSSRSSPSCSPAWARAASPHPHRHRRQQLHRPLLARSCCPASRSASASLNRYHKTHRGSG